MNPRRSIRLVAGSLAALWLVLPVAAAVHGALEAHEYCLEHQAFEHASDSDSAACVSGDAIVAASEAGEHANCSFDDALTRTAVEVDGPAAVRTAASVQVAERGLADGAVATAVLAVAPKTSPPAALV